MIDIMTSVVTQPDSIARQPQQQRARDRFESVLAEAEVLLLQKGVSGFSIPDLAERLDFTRASIYKFFPTPYAVINELTVRYLSRLEKDLTGATPRLLSMQWSPSLRGLVDVGADFYNANPIACMLILGGTSSDESYRALELTIERLGNLGRALLQARGIKPPAAPPDIAVLAVQYVMTTYRVSYFLHGSITDAYRAEAHYMLESYLARYAEGIAN